MSKDEKAEPYYQKRAEEFIDLLFDGKMFNPDLKREDMRAIEDYVAQEYQAQCQSAVRANKLMEKARHLL